MHNSDDKLARLLNSALAVDALMGHGFRREADLSPEEHERAEAWRLGVTSPGRLARLKNRGGRDDSCSQTARSMGSDRIRNPDVSADA
jgi:hypothetical protein